MRASFALSAIALSYAALVAAQDQTIQVGGGSNTAGGVFQFIPPTFNATEGSVITFNFTGIPGAHSISQSNFTDPCQPLPGGFDSGFVLISAPADPFPTWNLTITNASQPIWFFCKQLAPQPHCKAGMVGGINVPASGNHSFTTFQAAARSSSGNPGQAEGGLVGIGASASAPPSPLTGSVQGSANPTGASAPTQSGAAASTTGR
ncbi:hypothetical protein OF83DRAFT_621719 [Amylostereum chailletii]|nr:hypothetical protein OF83DRAFT_621719 [Amylostereum chailletii]